MPRPGPDPKVTDDRLLVELLIHDDNAIFATEVQDHVALETVQGVRDRLNKLADETDYVEIKHVSNRNLYRLTDRGRERALSIIRSRVD